MDDSAYTFSKIKRKKKRLTTGFTSFLVRNPQWFDKHLNDLLSIEADRRLEFSDFGIGLLLLLTFNLNFLKLIFLTGAS